MSSVPVLEAARLAQYSGAASFHAVEAPLSVHAASFEAEATNVTLSVVAVRNTEILGERKFVFTVQLTIDSTTYLWSDDGGALKAVATFDSQTRRINLSLTFDPVGKAAIAAAADSTFLRAVSASTNLALRMPDGELAPDVISIPAEFVINDSLLNYLQLLAEVSQLAGMNLAVLEEASLETTNDLLVARGLLRGEDVQGEWHGGEFRLAIAALPAIQKMQSEAARHAFLLIAPLWLEISKTQVYLGEIRQHIPEAIIDDVRVDEQAGKVILHVSAPGGSAATTFTPIVSASSIIEANVVLPDVVFDELLADLDAPPRNTRLRELL